jgi:GTPase
MYIWRRVRQELSFIDYAPVIFISAKTGQRVMRILDLIERVTHQYFLRLSTAVINEVLREAVSLNPPSSVKSRLLKIFYGTQTGVKPPTFAFFVNEPELMHFSYKRYLENTTARVFRI